MSTENNGTLNISVKSFLTSITVIFCLMVLTFVLTCVIPGGTYLRDEATGELIEDSYRQVEGGIPFFKWLLSPILVLGASGSGTLIAVIAFLLVIGGIFNALGEHGLMRHMLRKIAWKYGKRRYILLTAVTFFFMAMGAMLGSFEECVPLVPIAVALAVSVGFDELTGMGMSLLAVGCGFASGVCNPFSVGVAQELAGLPMFSGLWFRLLGFCLIFMLLIFFLRHHAKKTARPISETIPEPPEANAPMDRGLLCFGAILGAGIALVLCSGFLTFLQDYTMVIVAVMFLVGGITASLVSGMKPKKLCACFLKGAVGVLPAVLMILMAASVKYTLESACVLDTLLFYAVELAETLPKWVVILFIYLIVLVMNFFIGSGSAKAFMLIPLIVPLAGQFSISAQLCIAAFAYGDGFSNVLYPTNAALLISLGLAKISYGKWAKWSLKFQCANLVLTSLLLLFGLAVGY